MLGFIKKFRAGTTAEKVERYKVILSLAKCCVLDATRKPEIGNLSLYNAVSHLAQVSELEISMVSYDHLQFNMNSELDDSVMIEIQEHIQKLEKLIASL